MLCLCYRGSTTRRTSHELRDHVAKAPVQLCGSARKSLSDCGLAAWGPDTGQRHWVSKSGRTSVGKALRTEATCT